jgi:tetratricopeptide (TPR) repeat protein
MAYLFQNPGILILMLGCALIVVGLLARANVKGVELTIDAGKYLRAGAVIVGVLLCMVGVIVQFEFVPRPVPSPVPSPIPSNVSSSPQDPKGLYEDAKERMARGQTTGVVEELQKAADGLGDPHQVNKDIVDWAPALYADLGFALLDKERPVEAKKEFYYTLYLDPNNNTALDGLGRLANNSNEKLAEYYLEFGNELTSDPARAEKFFNKYIQTKPDDPEGYYKLGTTFYNRQNWDKADANFTEAQRRITPGYELTQAYLNNDWGFTLLQERKYDDAIKKFEAAVAQFNNLGQDSTWAQKGLDSAHQQKATPP